MMIASAVLGVLGVIYKSPQVRVDWTLVWVCAVLFLLVPMFGFPVKSKFRDGAKQKWRAPHWGANPFNFINDPVQLWHAGAWNAIAMGMAAGVFATFFSPDDTVIGALEIVIGVFTLVGIKLWQILFPSTVDP